MSGKKPAEPSSESIARAERQRLAQEDGERAMADLERQATDMRNNMERLRALREAREADEMKNRPIPPPAVKKKRKRRIVR
jgi:uncharacterized protein with von Willebrand factor type A (vWA) domain